MASKPKKKSEEVKSEEVKSEEVKSEEVGVKENEPKENEPKENEPKENEPKENEPKENEPKENEPKENEPKENEPKESESNQQTEFNKSVVLTNLTKNPIELVAPNGRDKVVVLVGCMVRVPLNKFHEVMKNPMVKKIIEKEIIRCSDHGIVDNLNNRASVENAPAHLKSSVVVGGSEAKVERFNKISDLNEESLGG